jgi:hypothetical protein
VLYFAHIGGCSKKVVWSNYTSKSRAAIDIHLPVRALPCIKIHLPIGALPSEKINFWVEIAITLIQVKGFTLNSLCKFSASFW